MSKPEIWIEKVERRPTGPQAAGQPDKLIKAAPDRFGALGEALAEAADKFWAGLKQTEHPPQEVEMELNIAVEAGGDWFIVSGKASASASVKLIWKRP